MSRRKKEREEVKNHYVDLKTYQELIDNQAKQIVKNKQK